jgi:hypothetical protein
MPRMRVVELTFHNNGLRQPGEELDWDTETLGEPGENLELVEDAPPPARKGRKGDDASDLG